MPQKGHGATGIGRKRPFETLDAFIAIEAITPVETFIEPALRLGRLRCDGAAIGAQFESIHK
jgi:hypothetical protein